ncbi:hypothetical protein Phi18:3_gp030 [Cellulophaga phage phi18:3]|uniref:Uncharacterized protein n=1 Tax=Cellulophaga phage phi18:3 TaxID=1327983 RepID=S0A259_9CAUD|nr:hypothetical protein Phi18:3_gp030 [Cellulophaga phage phi18:3]AGO48542.1 hypothetical protein Phi18:3_gp030 [Cellulophaga phage phi18:3]
MKKEITELKDLKGKTIVDTKMSCGELWIKFSDDTFAVFIVNNITEGFGHTKEEVNLYQYGKDETEHTLLELGLITKQEYEKACKDEELRYKKLEEKREKEQQDRIKRIELEQLENLSKKYNR